MADYTIAAADVFCTGVVAPINAGEDLVAGLVIYSKVADHLAYKADADAGSGADVVLGFTLNDAKAGQPVAYARAGPITVGTIFAAAGKVLALSGAAGKLCDIADVTTGDHMVIMGWTLSTTSFQLNIINTGFTL